jgi:aryl-alcohol dehydrogenase-like predicted oxidoreductase
MNDQMIRTLGRTGLKVGRLGVACSYGAPTEAFEEAFERGVNYFYWGSTRKTAMARAIGNIMAQGQRDRLVIAIQSYSRSAGLMELFYRKALNKLGINTADVLLLGWHNRPPTRRILDRALEMREKGMYRHLAISGHHRPMFADLADHEAFDLFHVRYNAAHRGAESDVFDHMASEDECRPGIVTYTATRWGDLLKAKKMPSGEAPLSGADCYRFVLTNDAVDVCMTGPKNLDQMREALLALERGPLGAEEMERAKRIGDHIHANYKRLFS